VPPRNRRSIRAVKAADLTSCACSLTKSERRIAIKTGGTPLMPGGGGGPARAQEEEVVDKTGRADPVEVTR